MSTISARIALMLITESCALDRLPPRRLGVRTAGRRSARLDGQVAFRVTVRVQPGAPRTGVGGSRGEALVVRVAQPPEDGRATEACLRAIADAFAVPRRAVRLVAGATSRDKTVELDGVYADLAARAAELRATGAPD